MPPRILALEAQLAAQYREFVKASAIVERDQREKDFNALNNLIKELSFSPALFARKYFIDASGRPAPEMSTFI